MATPTKSLENALLPHAELLTENLNLLSTDKLSQSEPACTTFCSTLDTYLQLPTLLDPLLPTLMPQLCTLFQTRLQNFISNPSQITLHHARRRIEIPSAALYTLAKVRGIKPLSRHFPHQVPDLHFLVPALLFLESHNPPHRFWQVRYILFSWLSVAIRVPFPLDTILHPETLTTLQSLSRDALCTPGPVSTAAATFLSRLLARRDAAPHRNSLLLWAVRDALPQTAPSPIRIAALTLLAAVFKHAHSEDLRPHIISVLSALRPLAPSHDNPSPESDTRQSHLVSKLSGRLALAVLPPRPATWRYRRGNRVIFARAANGGVQRQDGNVTGATGHVGELEPSADDGYIDDEAADTLEAVIELLLTALQHRDTIVRWSAAKHLGRVTSRLPLELAQDVVEGVFDLFRLVSEARAEAAWHGACLALAELARRGLLLPREAHFRTAFEVVAKAAAFDQRRGASSVGASVRDAACYAVWAVARAYAREDVAPFASEIMEGMLPVALFDREVNCRRAAAAALQECVGRLSEELFRDGIQLITIADYFSLGDRVAAYLTIAPKVAKLAGGEYFDCIVHELAVRKLVHWDIGIRSLAARALASLVDVDAGKTIVRILPDLVHMSTKRHGAVLGLAELAVTLQATGLRDFADEVRAIPRTLKDKRLLTGRTGDEIRIACCHLLRNLATHASELYKESSSGREDAEYGLDFLERILGCGKEGMYAEAASAYSAICGSVISHDKDWHIKVTRRILKGMSQGLFERQRGFALAAGVCGFSDVSSAIVDVLSRELSRSKDVEVRRNCGLSLGRLPQKVLVERVVDILDALCTGMNDYTTDERGDIGSWVREASMISASKLVECIYDGLPETEYAKFVGETDEVLFRVLKCVLQQCCSRIDRTRVVAGKTLSTFCKVLTKSEPVPFSSFCRRVAIAFRIQTDADDNESADVDLKSVNFAETESVFPCVRKALEVEEVADALLAGLVFCGGGAGLQSKFALEAAVEYFQDLKDDKLKRKQLQAISEVISSGPARLTIPAYMVLETLAKRGALDNVDSSEMIMVARTVRRSWRHKLKDVRRTGAAVSVLGELAALSTCGFRFEYGKGTIGRECLEALVVVLGGPIPRLRRITAECIYMILIEFAGDENDTVTADAIKAGFARATVREGIQVLLDTEWEKLKTLDARARRNLVCTLLGISAPVVVRAAE